MFFCRMGISSYYLCRYFEDHCILCRTRGNTFTFKFKLPRKRSPKLFDVLVGNMCPPPPILTPEGNPSYCAGKQVSVSAAVSLAAADKALDVSGRSVIGLLADSAVLPVGPDEEAE